MPQLRNVAPVAVAPSAARDSLMLEAVVVSGAQSGVVAQLRGRASTTSWPIISSGTAHSLLGTDPVGLPGLARKIRRDPANNGTVVVEQQIDSATTIQIFQQQNATAALYRIDTSVRADKA